MTAGQNTATGSGGPTGIIATAIGDSDVSSAHDSMTTIETAAATGGIWTIYTGGGTAITMTAEDISAARGPGMTATTGAGEGIAITMTKIGRS
jgi:hypothetical protein